MRDFKQTDKAEWYLYVHPFVFWIFETEGQFDIAWHYGDSTGQQLNSSLNDAQLWCYQFMLKTTVQQLKDIAPPNGRTEIIDHQYKFVCDGSISDMGYHCYLDIGHSGDCWTKVKKVHFKREANA